MDHLGCRPRSGRLFRATGKLSEFAAHCPGFSIGT